MIKFSILLKRHSGWTQEQFVDHHRNVHAALFMSVPVVRETVRAYVQQHAVEVTMPGLPGPKYDGITELWFNEVEALGRCFSDAEYLRLVRPDEEVFLDVHACDFLVTTATAVAGKSVPVPG